VIDQERETKADLAVAPVALYLELPPWNVTPLDALTDSIFTSIVE
jgi:hypothetical protein